MFRKLKKKMQIKNERRIICRMKAVSERKSKLEESLKEEKKKLIRKQKEITGDQFDDRSTTHAHD